MPKTGAPDLESAQSERMGALLTLFSLLRWAELNSAPAEAEIRRRLRELEPTAEEVVHANRRRH